MKKLYDKETKLTISEKEAELYKEARKEYFAMMKSAGQDVSLSKAREAYDKVNGTSTNEEWEKEYNKLSYPETVALRFFTKCFEGYGDIPDCP